MALGPVFIAIRNALSDRIDRVRSIAGQKFGDLILGPGWPGTDTVTLCKVSAVNSVPARTSGS